MIRFLKRHKKQTTHSGGIPSLRMFRLRIIALVLLAFLPIFALTILTATEQSAAIQKSTAEETMRLVRLVAADQAQSAEGARQLLVALAQLPEVKGRDSAACSALFATFLRQYSRYITLGAVNSNGDVFCSALPQTKPKNVSESFWFNGVRSSNYFFGGDYQYDPVSGQTSLDFGFPIRSATGQTDGAVYASLDLSWLNRTVAQLSLPKGATFFLLDHEGKILLHYPDPEMWVGRSFTDSGAGKTILSRQTPDTVVGRGVDGVKRLFAFTRLSDTPGTENLSAVASIPLAVAVAGANQKFYRNLAVLGFITLVTLLAAWFFGNILVLRQIRALQDVDRLKSEFVSLASHQLRTPLTSISWALDNVRSGHAGVLTKEQKEFLDDASHSASNLMALVRDLLNLSRIEARRLTVSPAPTDLVRLANEVISEAGPELSKKSLTLQRSYPKEPLVIPLDPVLIRQVIMNFLSNAIKYTPEGGTLRVSISRTELDALLTVLDTGVGIPQDEQGNVFHRFFRASNAHEMTTEGTGLGLYLAKELVELSGGAIGFESVYKKGSVFWFSLPLSGSVAQEGDVTLG